MSVLTLKHCCLCFLLFVYSGMSRAGDDGSRALGRVKGPCGDVDIRNDVRQFQKLVNCTVIEGELQILLIDYAKAEDYESLHFPDLVEIKDYLLLYRVHGLRSLRNIFPNLAVIRGEKLFSNYALIAFEMQNLEELGLVSLSSIPKGAVRLEKNPNLCYIETIDWGKIVTGIPVEENFFKGNKDTKECVNMCPRDCPTTKGYIGQEPRCWTLKDCQKILACQSPCPSGLCNGTICCNSNCIGGCTGPAASDCVACKDVIQYPRQGERICARNCSAGTFRFKNRRCLLHDQCVTFNDYKVRDGGFKLVIPDSISKPGLCVDKCPAGTKEDNEDKSKCVPCQGKCPRVCAGKVIDSINSAQELKGCTNITGPLEINIMGGSHIGQELEENLSQIEEVTEHIRIYHSYALLSLYFFKNLKTIRGSKLYQNRYSLVVFDNLNLQELFLERVARNLTLVNGTVWFQYNRKLCYKKIESFVKMIGHEKKTKEADISKETNGDQMPCDIHQLAFNVLRVTPHIAILSWANFNITDPRHLISYTINYKEAPVKNVSIYQGRDACSDDLWKTLEVAPETDVNATRIHAFITSLKPWTQYAVYVQTLTISKAIEGAISDVIYFRTAAEVPTSPTNLRVRAEHPGELHITWDPPLKPNGNVTHYEVYWQLRDLDTKQYELRDYCAYPLTADLQKREQEEEEENKNKTLDGQCCACPPSDQELKQEAREREMEIQFQDFLQNQVYIKRLDRPATTLQPNKTQKKLKKVKREAPLPIKTTPDPHEKIKYTYQPSNPDIISVNLSANATDGETDNTTVSDQLNTTKEINNTWPKENPYFKAYVYENREMFILNLGHFEDYNIEVIACQERDPRDTDRAMLCSHRAIGLGRTLPNKTSDNVNASTIQVKMINNRTAAVHISWSDPAEPNGLIVTYEIEYSKSNIQNVKPTLICITYKMYRDVGKKGHTLENLDSGNYTFRIRATSLAGNGSWTEPMSFNIPAYGDEEMSKEVMIAIILACLVFVVLVTIFIVWIVAKKKFGDAPKPTTSMNPDYIMDFVYEPDEWEVDRDNVELLRELGQGSFGMVYEGIVRNLVSGKGEIKVAVKTTNANSSDYDRYSFLQEASIMKAFYCHHVVRLVGVVSKGQPAYVLMELMAQGDLKNFLRLHRPDEEDNNGRLPPTLKQIMQMAGEIADGMAYLADKKYVHRDLAARNCMVGEDMTVKIGDFGMTRDIYETDYYRKGNRGLLPVRWMAPESIKDGVFTSMSDVWSYGVVLWEMATLAAQPYQGLANEEVLRYVGSGKIMDTPERCPPKLYDLMVKCWRFRQKQRPTFKEIIEILLPDLDKKFQEVSYFFSEEAKQASSNHHTDINDDQDEELDEGRCPMNDYVDEANLPFLGSEASNGVELEDIFTDTGSYPWNHRPIGSDVCGCNSPLLGNIDDGAAAQAGDLTRQSACSSPNSAIGGSSDGSKGSSKSSSSSYAHMNGLSVANGHVPPMQIRTTHC